MDGETIFTICNLLVLPVWLMLAVAPRWRPGTHLIAPVIVPGLLGVVYAYLILTNLGGGEGDFSSLAGVAKLFENPLALLAGWIHYLAFDLFIGAWEVRDAQRNAIGHLWMLPCLFFTLMLGPIGLLLYLVLRTARGEMMV